jgi:serine/threonine-protein kinase
MNSQRNALPQLLPGVLAARRGWIRPEQLEELERLVAAELGRSAIDQMMARGWLDADARRRLEAELVAWNASSAGGDDGATVAGPPIADVETLAATVSDPNASRQRADAVASLDTVAFAPTLADHGGGKSAGSPAYGETVALPPTIRDPGASSASPSPDAATQADFSLAQNPGRASGHDPSTLETLAEPFASKPGRVDHIRLNSLAEPPSESIESRYTITKLHAKGGIGQVWVARDASLGREVALKELKPGRRIPDDVWARFVEEARITGQLEHPGIAPVYELGRRPEDGHPYYTMKFIRGGTLADAIEAHHEARAEGRDDPLARTRLLEAFMAVCNTIGYAHARGVIHRDLKSQNVVLGDFGEAIVLDWGLAKMIDLASDAASEPAPAASATAPNIAPPRPALPALSDTIAAGRQATLDGQIMGTPAFMPPEQASGDLKALGVRSDVYSLGAILYDILTGRPPFGAGKVDETLRQVREVPPVPPRQILPTVAPELEAVALKALAKRPSDRYASALDLAEEIRRFLADEPVTAYPEPPLKRAARWARKHRAAVASGAAAVLAGLVITGGAYVLVRQQRNAAIEQKAIAQSAVDRMYTDVAEQWLEDTSDPIQRAFLEEALAYYKKFADAPSAGPIGRLETAKAFLRVGDVERKLGRPDKAEPAYVQALDRLVPLADKYPSEAAFAASRARARERLAALLDARGDRDQAATLFDQARLEHERLAARRPDDTAALIDLARTCREQATMLRSLRKNDEALAALNEAVATLDPLAKSPAQAPVDAIRELGAALEKQGLILTDLGRWAEAETILDRACNLLEPVQARNPHNPRVREVLAGASDLLGRTLQRLDASDRAEPALRRAVDHYEVLARTFPDRPEYRRLLARGQINLGAFFLQNGRNEESRRIMEAANETLAGLDPERTSEPLKVRRDRATARRDLGASLEALGQSTEALAAYKQAVTDDEALVKQFPDTPDYQEHLALSLDAEARLLAATDPEAAVKLQERACSIADELLTRHADVAQYQGTAAHVRGGLGILLVADDPTRAEAAFRQAIAAARAHVEKQPDDPQAASVLAQDLSNLAEVRPEGNRLPDAETLGREAVTVQTAVLDSRHDNPRDLYELAVYETNLGEQLAEKNRPGEARTLYASAGKRFDTLVARPEATADDHAGLAYLETDRGKLALETGQPTDARAHFEQAVASQRAALKVAKRRASESPELREQIALLARATLEANAIDDAARTALELARTAPARPEARLEAARLLAACADRIAADTALAEPDRQARARAFGDRAVAQLRVAVDAGLKPDTPLADDPALKPLNTRDDFRALSAETAAPANAG